MAPFADPVVVVLAAAGLLALALFVGVRLLRSRSSGLSIRMQIFLALASIVGVFALALGVLVLDRIKARADLVGREAALGEARAAAAMVGIEMETSGRTLQDIASQLGRSPRLTRQDDEASPDLTLIDRTGHVVLDTGRSPHEAGVVSASAPIEANGEVVGQARVVKPTLVIRKTLADFAPTVLVLSLVLVLVAALAAVAIGGTIGRPIEALTQFAERISQGERGAPPPPGQGREVKCLARSLDSMRRELQGRRFVETFAADLSHELKNPVAAIRASAEVLNDGALEEPEEAERFVRGILEATSRIEALLGDLLSLARLEARGVDHELRLDLREVVTETVHAANESKKPNDLAIELVAEGSCAVRGDAGWLARAVANLLDNAAVHAEAGQVRVRVFRDADVVRCHVDSPGRVHPSVKPRLFRRFVTTRADRGGTGLGLAIVRAVAEAHGGEASCTAFGPPRVRFEIALPAA